MKQSLRLTHARIKGSAFMAGAMPQLFLGVGSPTDLGVLESALSSSGFELVQCELNPLGLFPKEFLSHEGTHFNRKLFILRGIDRLVGQMGPELIRRIEFESRRFQKTATWSLVWVETLETANLLRMFAPNFWREKTSIFVCSSIGSNFPKRISTVEEDELLPSSLGETRVPQSISQHALSKVMNEVVQPDIRFWRHALSLEPVDALLDGYLLAKINGEVQPEVAALLARFSEELGWGFMETAQPNLKSENVRRPTWVSQGEEILHAADQLITNGELDVAAKKVFDYLESSEGPRMLGAWLLAERPLKFLALVCRALGKWGEAMALLDLLNSTAAQSGLPTLLASAYEAKALHLEEMGDVVQGEKLRDLARVERSYLP